MLLRKWASYRRIRKYVKSHQSSNDRFWREAVIRINAKEDRCASSDMLEQLKWSGMSAGIEKDYSD
jgi:hypothetical protein